MNYVYILRCRDGSLYAGMTNDLRRRMTLHTAGRGAKYTRGRGPLELAYQEGCGTHSQALKREAAVKRLPRQEKEALISGNPYPACASDRQGER